MLGLLHLPFDVTRADIDETPLPGEHARDYTARLSCEKAQAIAAQTQGRDVLILAADTTVADGPAILGKPDGADDARAMLRQLRGRTHPVYTAISLLDAATGHALSEVAVTEVTMRDYSDAEIGAYIASGDPFDKAGAYAIQNTAFHPVVGLRGCYPNVMGLPLCLLAAMLRAFGVEPPPDAPGLCLHPDGLACDLDRDTLNRL